MNTKVTRPGHMLPPLWTQGERQPYGGHVWYAPRDEVGGFVGLDEDTPAEAAAEARIMRWLDRSMWLAGGMCLGCLAMWAGIAF